MPSRRPLFIVIAGPNGAGKTSLFESQLRKRFPEAEFVNADRLAQERFGHPAKTQAESETGQELAENRRRQLMAERKSLITESTFSHPSKLDLIRDAKAAGYAVLVYHVNVRSADLAVLRVRSRVGKGGHPVPEERTRARYERNQPLIRQVALQADHAYIYDNSELTKPHRLALELHKGKALRLDQVPAWARSLYAKELKEYAPQQINSPAASFAAADALVKAQLGAAAQTYIARPGATYAGVVVGKTAAHTVQQIAAQAAVAHFNSRLDRACEINERITIHYGRSAGTQAIRGTVLTEQQVAQHKTKAEAFRTLPAKQAVQRYPELAVAYLAVQEAERRAAASHPKRATQVVSAFKEALAQQIERGLNLQVKPQRTRSPTKSKTEPSRER